MLFGTQNTFWVAGYGVLISSNRLMFECLFVRGSLSLVPTGRCVEVGQGFLPGMRADITFERRKQVHFLTARQLHSFGGQGWSNHRVILEVWWV